MHTTIHTATSVLCVHLQFSFHRDGEVTHALSTRKACFWCIFNLHFGTNLLNFWSNFGSDFPQLAPVKSAFLSLFFHSPRALLALKKLKKTRRCLNPAAGARDRRITALKKSSLQQQKSTKRRMEFPSETAGNAGWISKSDGIITPKVGRPRGKHRVKKI